MIWIAIKMQLPEGILIVDGSQIPAFAQSDTYIVVRSKGAWLITEHAMRDRNP